MLTKETIRYVREVIAPQRSPVLSLYLDVHPGRSGNAGGAPLIRAKEALKALDLPKDVVARLLKRLQLENDLPQARTLVVFADEDPTVFYHSYLFALDLPVLADRGVLARWGAPFIHPLLSALDAQDRHAVVFIDRARWRYFEVFFGEIEELHDAFRPLDTALWRSLDESKTATAQGVPARGGSGKDHFERRKEEWTRRFYRDVVPLLRQALEERGARTLVLVGLPAEVAAFEQALPQELRNRVILRLPPPPDPAAPARAFLERLEEPLEAYRCRRERELLERIEERGIRGLQPTLEALQQGRLRLVTLPWHFDRTVYRCRESGRVSATLGDSARGSGGKPCSLERLQEVIPELAQESGSDLTYLHTDAAAALEKAGGLGGLLRW